MLSRVFLVLAGCFAFAAAGEYYVVECYFPEELWCEATNEGREKCCSLGWSLDASTGVCQSKETGETCDLCQNAQLATWCGEFVGATSSQLLDADGNPVDSTNVGGAAAQDSFTTIPGLTVESYNSAHSKGLGWPDTNAQFFFTHDSLLGIGGAIPTFVTPKGFTMSMDCDATQTEPDDSCNLYVFLYRCDACERFSGLLPELLLASDYPEWHVYHCGPYFTLSDSTADVQHPFVVYTAEVPPGKYAVPVGGEEVRFLFWGHVRKSVTCGNLYSEQACNDPLCRWDTVSDLCLPNICPPPRQFVGPFERCQVCVGDPEAQEQLPTVIYN